MAAKKTAKTAPKMVGEGDPQCEYVCRDGQWKLVGIINGGPNWHCQETFGSGCINGQETVIDAEYVGGSLSIPTKPKHLAFKNAGEYLYLRGEKDLRLVDGRCGKGYFLPTSIAIRSLGKLHPTAAEFLKTAIKLKVASVQLRLPAQKFAAKR